MPNLTEYKVMLINPAETKTLDLLHKLINGSDGTNGLKVAMGAYRTEMALMTNNPEHLFNIQGLPVCVAFTEDYRVLGFISVGADPETKTVCTEHVYVRPELRHQGIYKLMMKRVEKLATDLKFERIVSFVFEENDLSQQVHEKQGFKKRMVGYIKEIKCEQK